MGYIRHHAIVVTSWDDEALDKAHAAVIGLGATAAALTSPIIPRTVNGYRSFFVAPDGSKEGWDESNVGDVIRDSIVDVLRSFAYSDGSTSVQWCEVQFGDDNGDNRILRSDRGAD